MALKNLWRRKIRTFLTMLGIAVGVAILAIPYIRRLVSVRLLAPILGLAAVVAIIVAQRADFSPRVDFTAF